MKPNFLKLILAALVALTGSALSSMAQTGTTTFTTATSGSFTGDVINSTYSFSGLNTTSFTATFEQTQIPADTLNNIAPPANFQLKLTSLNYVDTSDTFTASLTPAPLTINVAYTMQPTITQGSMVTGMLTLVSTQSYTGTVTASTQNPIDFELASPVTFPLSIAQNLGNLASVQSGQPVSTWTDNVSNLEKSGQATETVNGQTIDVNLNGTFSNLDGSLEVVYATPEPGAISLGAVAVALFAVLYRRHRLKF